MHALVQDCAAEAGLSLQGRLSEVCQQAGVNRTQIYEKKAQLKQVLAEAEVPGPGRPTKGAVGPDEGRAGDGLREHQVVRVEVVQVPAMHGIVPIAFDIREPRAFRRWYADSRTLHNKLIDTHYLIAVVVCK